MLEHAQLELNSRDTSLDVTLLQTGRVSAFEIADVIIKKLNKDSAFISLARNVQPRVIIMALGSLRLQLSNRVSALTHNTSDQTNILYV